MTKITHRDQRKPHFWHRGYAESSAGMPCDPSPICDDEEIYDYCNGYHAAQEFDCDTGYCGPDDRSI